MPSYSAIVNEDGTVKLPDELRARLHIKDGSEVEFFLTVDGQVHFHALTGSAKGFGDVIYDRRKPPLSIREMDDSIADYVSEKHDRIARQLRDVEAASTRTKPAAE